MDLVDVDAPKKFSVIDPNFFEIRVKTYFDYCNTNSLRKQKTDTHNSGIEYNSKRSSAPNIR